ncbi:hypothetical protein BS47DRAFT_1367089 [Hydnum rufescens UP504]|uniref:Uncharacterized protein n=1 Tax=Hydnum rufescens UP504 TaxID=1448309 RepID=A0A9P6AK70_9AGAM|nr:hypothetical protein BS47DRAFT_1367089 [Hydnum rufescens UP504]
MTALAIRLHNRHLWHWLCKERGQPTPPHQLEGWRLRRYPETMLPGPPCVAWGRPALFMLPPPCHTRGPWEVLEGVEAPGEWGGPGGFYNGKMAAPHPSLYWGVVTAPGLSVDGGGGVARNENFPAIAGKLNLGLNAGNCPVSKASHLLL